MYSLANLQANTLVKILPTKHSNSTSLCTPNTTTAHPLSPRTTSRRAQTSNGSTRTPLSNISLEIYVPAYSETRCRNCLSVLISHWFSSPPQKDRLSLAFQLPSVRENVLCRSYARFARLPSENSRDRDCSFFLPACAT
jgi:hypothetical protein